jgi:hypothetical protein
MLSNLSSSPQEAARFRVADAPVAAWVALRWGFLVPAVFAGNVVLAVLAWFSVEWMMKLI